MAGLGPTVKLTFAGDDSGLSRTIASVEAKTSSLGSKLGSIGKGLAPLAALSSGVSMIGGAVGAVTALSGAALLIPGAALAGAAAMQTFKLATAGFGDAMSAGLSGDMEAFAEATKDMHPEMATAARTVAAMKPQVDGLKKAVQGGFWDQFSVGIEKAGNTYLPLLTSKLPMLSTELGNIAKQSVNASTTPFFTGAVTSILGSTTEMMRGMRSAGADVLTGLVGIGQVGATYLPALGTSIGNVATRFRAWVTSMEGQSQIRAWIDQGITAFGQLGAIASNIGSTLGSVFTGLGGSVDNPLQKVVVFTAKLAELAASPQGQQALTALGTAAQAAGLLMSGTLMAALNALVPVIVALAPLVTTIATVMASWAPVLGPLVVGVYGLTKAFQGVQAGLAIYNAAMTLAKSQTLITVATTVASWVTMAAGAMARAVVMAAAWVVAMGPIGWVIAGVVALAALVVANWDTIKAWTLSAWTAISAAMSSAWTAITTTVSTAITAVVGFLAALPGQVLGFLMQLPMMAATALGTLAGYVYLGAVAAWTFLTSTLPTYIGQAITWLASLPGRAASALSSLASAVMGVAVSAWNSFTSTTISYATRALAFVQTIPGRVGGFLAALPGILMGAASRAWTGFVSATTAGANAALAFVRSIPQRIQSLFSGAGSWLANAGSQLMNGLINGIRNAAQAVLNYIAALGAQIAASFRAAVGINSPSKVFAEFGVNIGQGLVVGIDRIAPAAVGSATGMAADVTAGARAVMATPAMGGGGRSAAGGGGTVTFAGNTSDELATVIMRMVRTGKIQIKAA